MDRLWIDFETRSRCNLPVHGVYNYAQDISTEVLCMSYAFNDEEVSTWLPGQPFPDCVRNHEGLIYAHNAAFERLIFWYVLQIDFDLAQFYCTAAQARANCAPGSLEDVGRFSGASMRKDHRGSQLIRLLSIPRADDTFNEDPELMAEMVAYCEQDVRVMRAISQSMRPLSPDELLDYHISEMINDRGVLVDVPLAKSALRYASEELVEIEQIVKEVTEGAITSVRSPKMRQWVLDRVGPKALELMTVYKDGEQKFSIDKSVRANLLILADDDHEEVPPHVADVIQCADDLWASSVAKFKRMVELADVEDNRVRGAFVFNGGSATGRASSYGLQTHNFARMCAKDPESVREDMVQGKPIVPIHGKRVTDVLKGMLRPTLISGEGRSFISLDWSGIEARVLPWLTNDPVAEATLDVFREGRDIYITTAANMFHVAEEEVDKQQRLLGKVSVLACGFAGSVGAFDAMGRVYGVNLPEADKRRMVNLWRNSNPWAAPFWQDVEEAYIRAMRNPLTEFTAGRITYMFDRTHLWYALPSGRILCYPFAKFDDEGNITYCKASWKPAAEATEWPRARLWRGLAVENCTQATANDLLRHSLREMVKEGITPEAHIHDEILVSCLEENAEAIKKRMIEIMTTPPSWAANLPLDVAGEITKRFGK